MKMIELSEVEKTIILYCKGHLRDEYPSRSEWTESFKPLFKKIYGWDADEFYNDYLYCLFQKLFNIYMKIRDWKGTPNYDIIEIFGASFSQTFIRTQELPIERAIAQLCGQISCVTVVENGVERFDLNLKEKS